MKALLRRVNDHGVSYDALLFACPGCISFQEGSDGIHMLPVNAQGIRDLFWVWNGDLEKPTLSPSILSHFGPEKICHSFLQDGVFDFLPDSTHKYAGMKIFIPDLPAWTLDLH